MSAEVLDDSKPENNMYGCSPCPKCGSAYRWPAQSTHSDKRIAGKIVCDDCGFLADYKEAPPHG